MNANLQHMISIKRYLKNGQVRQYNGNLCPKHTRLCKRLNDCPDCHAERRR